ncbi:probable carotenoid cleavage dioxygenase 4, chloroplastic [Tanacetum coccineum]
MRFARFSWCNSSIPVGLDGAYIRNGPNPQFYPSGPHHYFDGDGMVHCLRISHGRASFCSRYVKTNKYFSEKKLRSHVVPNVIGGMHVLGPFVARVALFILRAVFWQYDIGKGFGVANTSISSFGGRLYALCESGLPYEIRIKEDGDIITLGQRDFNDGNKQPDVPIFSMKQHSLTHDLAITKKYAIIFDIQLGASPMNLVREEMLVSADPTKVPKIGILPRYAVDESSIKWFDVPGLNILHAVNAWDNIDEDGNDVVVLVAPNIYCQ